MASDGLSDWYEISTVHMPVVTLRRPWRDMDGSWRLSIEIVVLVSRTS